MNKERHFEFNKRPFSLLTLAFAFLGIINKFIPQQLETKYSAKLENMSIDKSHLSSFNEFCDIKSDRISLIYPYTLIYPLYLRMLCRRNTPLSMFKVRNI